MTPNQAVTLWSYLRRAWRYLRPYRGLAFASLTLVVLGTLIGLLAPWPLKILIDSVLQDYPLPQFLTELLGPMAGDRTALLIFAVAGGFAVTLATNALTVV